MQAFLVGVAPPNVSWSMMQWEVGLDCKHCWLLDYEASDTIAQFPNDVTKTHEY